MEASYVIRAAGFSFHAVSVVGLFALHDPGDRGEPVPRAALCGMVLPLRALAALRLAADIRMLNVSQDEGKARSFGVVSFALGFGWLTAPRRLRKRRSKSK